MKRQQRHHLKENELAHSLVVAREYIEPRTKQVRIIAGIVAVVGIAVLAIVLSRQNSRSRADEALAEAMVAYNARVIPPSDPDAADLPEAAALSSTGTFTTEAAKLRVAIPKLQKVADAYPDRQAGIAARYHLAGAYAALGQNDDAIKQFGEVVKRAPKDSVYGRMARMGQADSQSRAGQIDAAIAGWKQLADENSPDIPSDAILLELGRAYAAKGNMAEARKAFTQLLEQHPTSPFSADAKTGLEGLKG
jgi:tetratricopeptide (TPR) repeat protein